MFNLKKLNRLGQVSASTTTHHLRIISVYLITLISLCAEAKPTLEDFGRQPLNRNMAMSPDGTRFAWLREDNNKTTMIVYDTTQGKVIGATQISEDIKARDVSFASNDYAILKASDTRSQYGFIGNFEYSGAFSYNLNTQKINTLLNGTKGLHPAQGGLGRTVGINGQENIAYMPAWSDTSTPSLNLYKVSLKTGKGRIAHRGKPATIDWFIDSQGKIIAREDFDPGKEKHSFYSYLSGHSEEVYSYKTDLPEISVQAISADEKHLLFVHKTDKEESVHSLSLEDGSISDALFYQPGKEIDYLLTDRNRKLVTVKYSGFLPTYEFEEDQAQSIFTELTQQFFGSRVDLLDKTNNNKVFLIRISGNADPNSFYRFNTENRQLQRLTTGYRNLSANDLGEIIAFKYTARDGLKVPALLTWPTNKITKEQRLALPLIVMPHGGPDAYDSIGFDWLTQFLAHKGYAVLQPNFRGSTGFGTEFHDAGRGRWGKEMQDDITDGVKYLIDRGIADKDKVCIAGASYGGYAALAGGAFTPDLYRCVISINGVSDIHAEIKKDIRRAAKKSWLINHWENVFDDDKKAFKKLNEVSPYYFAEKFQAPTLIIYSKDDTVVHTNQSKKMHKALEKATKDTTLVALKGEDHWLSTTPARLELLRTLDQYLDQHNPVH